MLTLSTGFSTMTGSPLRRLQELAASLEMAGRGFH